MHEILISFIIPMYNAQKDIAACMSSILNETRYSYEVILINDGSVDETRSLANKYAQEDPRIQVRHIENSGQGYARNLGIEMAQGRYLMFVDVDDQILPDGVNEILHLAQREDYDVVCGTYYRLEPQQEVLIGDDIEGGEIVCCGTEKEMQRFHEFRAKNAFGYLWNKVYKLEFLKQNALKLEEERKVFLEDYIFNLKVMSGNPKYYYHQIPVYRFDVRYASTTRKADAEITKKAITTVSNYYNFLCENQIYQEEKDMVLQLAMRVFAYSLIKNVPYEGISYKRIVGQVENYLEASAYKKILEEKAYRKSMKSLPSFAEKMLYNYCFLLLKYKQKCMIGITFVLANPIFKRYLNHNVK